MDWLSPLEIPLIRQAFWGLVVAGGTLSLLGTVIISLKLTGLRFTFMHVGLLGSAVALSVGVSPTLVAFLLILTVSGFMGVLGGSLQVSHNSLSGFFMTGSLAVAFLILAKAGVPAMEVFGIFAGNVLMLSRADLVLIVSLGSAVVIGFVFGFREIQLVLMDQELARNLGVPTRLVSLLLFLFVGAAVALALRLVGALLVDSLLLLPAMAALPLTRGLGPALVLTSLLGIMSTSGGFLMALAFDLPVGASVALLGSLIMAFSFLIQRRKK